MFSKKVKLLMMIMCLSSSLVFSACGKSEENVEKTRTSRADKDDEDSDNKKDKKDKKEKEEVKENINVPEPIAYTKTYEYKYLDSDDYSESYGQASICGIILLEDGYDNLEASIQRVNDDFYSYYQDFIDTVNSTVEDGETEYAFFPWEEDIDMYVKRADSVLFSINVTDYSYMGGAHGYQGIYGETFNSQTGEKLELEDVADKEKVKEYVVNYLYENEYDLGLFDDIRENGEPAWKNTVDEAFSENMGYLNWWLENDTILICFNAYDIAPYASGPIMIEIGNEYLKEEYRLDSEYECLNTNYNYYGDNYVCNVDVDNDGTEEQISIDTEYVYEGEGENSYLDRVKLYINYEDDVYEWDNASSYEGAYIMKSSDGSYYLYVQVGVYEYYDLLIFDLNDKENGLKPVDNDTEGYFGIYEPENSQNLLLENRTYILGTHAAYSRGYIGNNGQICLHEQLYYYRNSEKKAFTNSNEDNYTGELKVKKDFEAATVTDIYDEDGEKVTIKKGEILIPYVTNATSVLDDVENVFVILKREDGSLIRITFELPEDEYTPYIDGYKEDELLDGIFYAG